MTSIHTNVSAISALQTLRLIGSQMSDTQSQVSSGLRIDTASDNAAYWSIATTMRSDNKALSAVEDALGLSAAKVDTAYTGMASVIGILSDFKAKLIAASEPGVDRGKIQKELEQLKEQVVSISNSASFSGQNWLNTDIAELHEPAQNQISMVSSFARNPGGSVALQTTNLALDEISLFNRTGGGLLQSAKITKTINTPGGLVSDIGGLQTGATSDLPHYGHSWFTFSGARSLSVTDQISFDILVDANGASSTGASYSVTIDQALVNATLGKSDGSINTASEMSNVLKAALSAAGVPADSSRDYHYITTPYGSDLVDIYSRESISPGQGSSISISNVTSSLAGGYNFGMSQISSHNNNRPGTYVPFTAGFQIQMTATSQFSFDVNFPTAGISQSYTVTKAEVDSALGTSDGIVSNLADFATVLNSVVGEVSFSQSGGNLWISPDPSGPHIGRYAIFNISNMTASDILTVETTSTHVTMSGFDLRSIDVTGQEVDIDDLISAVDVMTEAVISGASVLGALQSRIDVQTAFAATIMETIDKGVGRLVDANMNEASTRLKALQTQEQLAIQSLQIANVNAANIMTLFR
jgi:flagellin